MTNPLTHGPPWASVTNLVLRPSSRFLLSCLKVNLRNKDGSTPLLAASEAGRAEVAELLLDRGARVVSPHAPHALLELSTR